jgi:hypothetical protein
MIDVCGKVFEFSTGKFEDFSGLRSFNVKRVESKSRTMMMNVFRLSNTDQEQYFDYPKRSKSYNLVNL